MNKQIIYTKLVNDILPFLIHPRQLIFCLWRRFAEVEYIFLHLHVKSYKINIQSCKHLESCYTQSSKLLEANNVCSKCDAVKISRILLNCGTALLCKWAKTLCHSEWGDVYLDPFSMWRNLKFHKCYWNAYN